MSNPAQVKAEFKAKMEKQLKDKMVAKAIIKRQNKLQKHGIKPLHSNNSCSSSSHSNKNTTILIYDLPAGTYSIQFPVWGSDYCISWDDEKIDISVPTTDSNFPELTGFVGGRRYRIKIYGDIDQFGLDKDTTNPAGSGCTSIEYLTEVEKIGPSILTYAFLGASSLVKVPKKLPCNVEDLTGMFAGCSSFNYPINCWNVSEVEYMDFMFYNASEFNQRLDKWDTHEVESMEGMFSGASNFNQPLNCWDVSSVQDMAGMFSGASNFNQPLDKWDTSSVTDMSGMFSSFSNMEGMFSGASNFNQPLNSWDVSNVEDMDGMFSGAFKFNQPLDKWNTSSVESMIGMFAFATSFNQPLFGTNPEYTIQGYNVGSVADMTAMFFFATSFNQPLDLWDVSNVTSNYDFLESGDYIGGMTGMFAFAKNFNQPLQNWNTEDVLNMSFMFLDATSFNQPLNNWVVSSVVNMTYMFYLASSFNQSLHLWDINEISVVGNQGAEHMLDYCGMSQYNWQTTLIGWYNICYSIGTTPTPNVGALGLLYNMYYNWQVYGNVVGDFDINDDGNVSDSTITTSQAWVELGAYDASQKSLVRKAVDYFTTITGHQEINYDT